MTLDRTVQRLTAAEAIVTCLKRAGITKAFTVPGESFLPLLDALYDEPDIELITTRHESGAAFMAEGYAKQALKPAAVLATRGVGASNLMIGVHTAYQDSTPMIVFLGQVNSRFLGREGFQELDLPKVFAPIAKWAVEITHAERTPEIVQRAIRTAISGRPGPVVISLPEDVLVKEAEMVFGPKITVPRPGPADAEIKTMEQLLRNAKRPVIIAGGGIKWAQAEEELENFAEKYALPVVVAFRRHDSFPHNHPLFAGHLGLSANKEVLKTIKEADLLLVLGSRLSEVTTQDYKIISSDKKLIHIDIDGEILGKVYPPDLGIIADVKEALTKMLELNIPVTWQNWARKRHIAHQEVTSLQASSEDVLNKQIIASLVKHLPEDAVITTDAGNFAGWLHAYYPFNEKHTFAGPTSGAMGYGLPAAIGAKIANPEKTVVALAGDGGFMMTVQELETAVRHQIPVIALVFNNKMYGTIRMHQEMHYPYRVIATDLGDVSFKKLAESVGANGYYVETISQFEEALVDAIQKDGPAVIEILTDREQISVSKTITELRQLNQLK